FFEYYRVVLIAEGISGQGALQSYHCGYITGPDLFYFLSFICMHLDQPAYSFLNILCRIIDIGAGAKYARVYSYECKLPDKGIRHYFERQSGKGLAVSRLSYNLGAVRRQFSHYWGDIHRRRQVVDNCIEQQLHSLILKSGPAEHRGKLH